MLLKKKNHPKIVVTTSQFQVSITNERLRGDLKKDKNKKPRKNNELGLPKSQLLQWTPKIAH